MAKEGNVNIYIIDSRVTFLKEIYEHLSPVLTNHFDIIVDRTEDNDFYAGDGRIFLDSASGIGVTDTSHCHPKVMKTIHNQTDL